LTLRYIALLKDCMPLAQHITKLITALALQQSFCLMNKATCFQYMQLFTTLL